MMMGHYSPEVVALSFAIAFLGSYLAISICEQYRQCRIGLVESRHIPTFSYLGIMAVCLGGVGIWCMHFIGMSAVTIYDDSGEKVDVRFDIGLTVLSLVLVLAFSLLGFTISSYDKIFMKTKRQIVELLIEDTASLAIRDIGSIKSTQILWIMATHFPQHLLGGGLVTGSGVVVMHYVGMAAMRFPGTILWDYGIIVASIIIAFLASTAAFWILFRLLSMYANKENLRLACGFTMAVAVCGMHYVGMVAASFDIDRSVNVSIKSTMSTQQAFLSGLLIAGIAGVIAVVIVLSDLRYSVSKLVNELSRADQMMMNMPVASANGCSNTVQKYLSKRKGSNFNLGIINQTMVFEGDHDDSSVQSGTQSFHHAGKSLSTLSVHRCAAENSSHISNNDHHNHHNFHHNNNHKQVHPASKYEDLEQGPLGANGSSGNHLDQGNNGSLNLNLNLPQGGVVVSEGELALPLSLPKTMRTKVGHAPVPLGSDKTATALSATFSTVSQVDCADFVVQDVCTPNNGSFKHA